MLNLGKYRLNGNKQPEIKLVGFGRCTKIANPKSGFLVQETRRYQIGETGLVRKVKTDLDFKIIKQFSLYYLQIEYQDHGLLISKMEIHLVKIVQKYGKSGQKLENTMF